jgi:pantoate--beta-alanine ligase
MIIVRTAEALRKALAPRGALRIGFVPTMGALHEGHSTLMRAARAECGRVVASVFVNPVQFNDAADLAAYPRDEARDAALADEAGADTLFVPAVAEIYPPGHATAIAVDGAAADFEGAHRPGHFNGVALVCVKLFHLVAPDVAYFGQKDAQQVAVIQQVVRDLDMPLAIHVVPTARDPDGLAMSSRNTRLSGEARERALAIPRALRAGLAAHRAGHDPVAPARAALAPLAVDYVDVARFNGEPVLVIAAQAGGVRLIDNVPLNDPARAGLGDR